MSTSIARSPAWSDRGQLTLESDKTVEITVEHFQIDGYAVLDFSLVPQKETVPAK